MENSEIGSIFQIIADIYRSDNVDNARIAYNLSRLAAAFGGRSTQTTPGISQPENSPQADDPGWNDVFDRMKANNPNQSTQQEPQATGQRTGIDAPWATAQQIEWARTYVASIGSHQGQMALQDLLHS